MQQHINPKTQSISASPSCLWHFCVENLIFTLREDSPKGVLFFTLFPMLTSSPPTWFEQFGCHQAFTFPECLLIHTRCMTQHSVI